MIKPEEVYSLNDEELMKVLKQAGLNKGPLTSTTRSLYEKKLIKFLKENKLPEENVSPTPTKTPSKTAKTIEKPKQPQSEPLKESNKSESIKASQIERNVYEEGEMERIRQREIIREPTKNIYIPQIEPKIVIHRLPEKKGQDMFENKTNETLQLRKMTEESNVYESRSPYVQKKIDPMPFKTLNEPKIIYPSSTQKQQSMFAPPLPIQRERTASRESFESRNKSQISASIFDKIERQPRETRNFQSNSSNSSNTTLPLEFKLINKDEPKITKPVLEERPFLGYIKTDRQAMQQNYLLSRRSIMKLDQTSPLRDQNKSPEFLNKPLIDISPRVLENKLDAKADVKSSIKITKLDNNKSDWLKNNLKYLLAVFVVTIIVYYSLQSTEENPLFE